MLFAVREGASIGNPLCHEHLSFKPFGVYVKVDGRRFARLHFHLIIIYSDRLASLSVEKRKSYLDIERFLCEISDGSRDRTLVAFAEEARHSWLNHQLLLSHHLIFHHAKAHILIVGKGEEAPCSHAFRQCKTERCHAISIRSDVRKEESGFSQFFSESHILTCLFF